MSEERVTSKANEQKACDAVQIMLELRFDHRRAEMWFPEADGRGPSVDLRGRLGRCEYALEHTRIEPFPGQIRTATRFSQFVRPIEQALDGTLPGPAHYERRFPLDPALQVPGDQ